MIKIETDPDFPDIETSLLYSRPVNNDILELENRTQPPPGRFELADSDIPVQCLAGSRFHFMVVVAQRRHP